MLKQGFEPRRSGFGQSVHSESYSSLLSTNGTNSFLFMTFVVDISFDVFKTETSAGPEAIDLAIRSPSATWILVPCQGNLVPWSLYVPYYSPWD